jgi:hypothetical protein
MQPEFVAKGNAEFRIGTCSGGYAIKSRFADIDQHRLVGDGSAGGRGPASYADGDRSRPCWQDRRSFCHDECGDGRSRRLDQRQA